MQCPKCGGSTSPNPNKQAASHPDWLCNQDNGKCGRVGRTGKWFATGAWNKSYQSNVSEVKSQEFEKSLNQDIKNDKWDKISWGKCKHAYLVESFKKDLPLEEVEAKCEEWADASMRKK